MKYEAHLEETEEGGYVASCSSVGVSAHGLSAVNALDALRREIRYTIELCPCSSVGDNYVELDVIGG